VLKRSFYFTTHALEEMDNDDLEIEDVMRIAETGEIIANYSSDKPLPSRLVLGWLGKGIRQPVHVVYAIDEQDRKHIITVYRPAEEIWDKEFRKKKNKKS
jgi:hypothetical protein